MIVTGIYPLSWSYKVRSVNFIDHVGGWLSNSGQFIDAVSPKLRVAFVGGSGISGWDIGISIACEVNWPGAVGHFPVGVNGILETITTREFVALVNFIFSIMGNAIGHITRRVTSIEMLQVGNRSHFIIKK